ncbi:HPr kinase/phosphorylase [Thermotomaculum hydrothermale]|uniref:HPr kinase/phosphorylase n=1 Tax=Thermotomaculum hydrothermale TaxID=981385 RepID=A0A7R6PTE6_9BACT|nr:hypothetical protein [Thermotomaculum hydrothermale]BBB32307.1 HPr kinase/phosphorylase [Thermotomaculum hydrothermale]
MQSKIPLIQLISLEDVSTQDSITFEFVAGTAHIEEKEITVPLQYQYLEKILLGNQTCVIPESLIITEQEGLEKLLSYSKHRIHKFFHLMDERNVSCLVVCNNAEVSNDIKKRAEKFSVPILRTALSSRVVISTILDRIHNLTTETKVIHGTMIDVFGMGVLLLGKSGVGKSETSLELIARGHRLVADDLVKLYKNRLGKITATCYSENAFGLMELRGVGIIDIDKIYGASALRPVKDLDIVIRLISWDEEQELKKSDSYSRLGEKDIEGLENVLNGGKFLSERVSDSFFELFNTKIYYREVPVGPGRNIATIVEVIVKNYLSQINRL